MLQVARRSFLCIILISFVFAEEVCKRDNIYRALKRQPYDAGDAFCSELLIKQSIIGTLEPTVTIPVYITSTDSKSRDPFTTFKLKGTKTKITTTNYASQTRTPNPTKFTLPFPSYIQEYPTSKVSSACSCLITAIPTYTQYRRCDILSTTSTSYYTLTYTTGVPNGKTVTYSYTDTTTKYKATTAAYPTACPNADQIDYIATDHSAWDRSCHASLSSYRPLDVVDAPTFTACIERCVDYNRQEGYTQCQGVYWNPENNSCERYNMPGYLGSRDDSNAQVATVRFFYPERSVSDYCVGVTATGAFLL
ncbi:MAG: hypothetical protein Q9182_002655 [Xanthomendoza sp. 2 TL-2023]